MACGSDHSRLTGKGRYGIERGAEHSTLLSVKVREVWNHDEDHGVGRRLRKLALLVDLKER